MSHRRRRRAAWRDVIDAALGGARGARPPGGPAHTYRRNLGCRRLDLSDLEGLFEVLVRGAVIHPRQRLTLARGALASGGQAAALLAVESHVGGQRIEVLLDQADVPLDDHVDAHLLGEREVLSNLAEESLRRAGKITAVADQPLNGAFACFENRLPGRERPLRAPG